LVDNQQCGLFRLYMDAKSQPSCGRFGRLDGAAQLETGPCGMFDDYGSRQAVFVAESVGLPFAHFALVRHHTAAYTDVGDALLFAADPRACVESEVGGVRNQPLFTGPYCLEDPFAGEGFFVDHAEAAAIERQRTRILEPKRTL